MLACHNFNKFIYAYKIPHLSNDALCGQTNNEVFIWIVGNRSTTVEISFPTSGCGVRSDAKPDGSVEMSVRLIIQMDEKLRQQSDLEKLIQCSLPNEMMEMKISMGVDKKLIR